ncbi:MAG: hypothetical protein M1463_04435, partial [Candidatus Thermoplasmatota archaeon]|nr:hypothetical protein [Candidatus Thermoplasmatota archaeon]
STLGKTVPGLKLELSGTAQLINGTTSYYSNINNTIGFEYGLPLLYLENYSVIFKSTNDSTKANYSAYNYTIGEVTQLQATQLPSISSLAIEFVNIFSHYWNTTNESALLTHMSNSVNSTLVNATFDTYASRYPVYPIMTAIHNVTLFDSYFANQSSTTYNASLAIIASSYSSDPTSANLITSGLSISIPDFTRDALNLGMKPSSTSVKNLSSSFLINATESVFAHNPLISVNPASISKFIPYLYTTNATIAIQQEMSDSNFPNYPILPSPYVFHQFVGYDNSTTIIIASFNQDTSASLITAIDNLTSTYTSTIPHSVYLVAGSSALNNQ